jgi:hypothetical protein
MEVSLRIALGLRRDCTDIALVLYYAFIAERSYLTNARLAKARFFVCRRRLILLPVIRQFADD